MRRGSGLNLKCSRGRTYGPCKSCAGRLGWKLASSRVTKRKPCPSSSSSSSVGIGSCSPVPSEPKGRCCVLVEVHWRHVCRIVMRCSRKARWRSRGRAWLSATSGFVDVSGRRASTPALRTPRSAEDLNIRLLRGDLVTRARHSRRTSDGRQHIFRDGNFDTGVWGTWNIAFTVGGISFVGVVTRLRGIIAIARWHVALLRGTAFGGHVGWDDGDLDFGLGITGAGGGVIRAFRSHTNIRRCWWWMRGSSRGFGASDGGQQGDQE